MNLPDGRLVHSRVADDPGAALATALDRRLSGYATIEPQEALLLDDGTTGLVVLGDGVPELAACPGTGRGGPEALADLAEPGPYSVELYEADPAGLPDPETRPECRVPPAMAAERLAGDPSLADRTRTVAGPAGDAGSDSGGERASAVEAFLEDEEKIAAIREQAREEAERRAEEWGLTDELE